ncbi:MAG: signal peptide peptidase SppA [Peptostreptococcaceae bacterium]|nr:signal peptide peptidase SppA [Peptostreptococcaceae bacterium]
MEDNNKGTIEENKKEKIEISGPNQEGVRTYSVNEKHKATKAPYKGVIIFGIIVLAIVVLAVSCNNLVGNLGFSNIKTGNNQVDLPEEPYIGTIYVEGTIGPGTSDYLGVPVGYQHKWTLNQIDELISDINNKGLIMYIDSPGGGVYESDELYLKIKEYQDKTKRPVYAYFGSMAASGGYYVSAGADKIIANRNCWTGSIGVTIGTLFDFSQLLENYGIKSTTITSGVNKAMGSNYDELTPEQLAIFHGLIDEAYAQFTGIVADGRGLDIETVKKIADGRVYTAKQALENGLIDKIASFDDAKADMLSENNLKNCEIVDLKYKDNSFLGTLLGKLNIKPMTQTGDLNIIMKIVDDNNSFPVSYMCEVLQ